jgi:tricorn protease interacting factor F2/3
MKDKREVLGDNVIPVNYSLEFQPDLRNFNYKCSEAIFVSVKKSTKRIMLNAVGLDIKNVTINSGKRVQKAKVKMDKKLERAIFTLKEPVIGNLEMRIEFEGKNGDKLSGFYRSKYSIGSKEEYMLTTQFEAADARKAFPCFDEPIFKATFDLSFIIDKELTVISNMPELKSSHGKVAKGKKFVRFNTSPKMSPYLLYFGIGKFERLKGKYRNIEFNVVTVPGKIRLAETALEYGKKFMEYYEWYFGLKYPLPKMDFIAIPDFAVSGMENWGAITYSEIALLTDKNASSVVAKQRIAEVVAHELAHQWFGDLVTMKWWDNLWLNESFATFMSFKAMKAAFPDWEINSQKIYGENGTAFGADQLRSTQPIGVTVNSPADMSEAFDAAITYSKGCAVLTMLEDYIGENNFRKGIRIYMKKYSYSNATEHDLWNSMDAAIKGAGNLKFDKTASYWINQKGSPVVNVALSGKGLSLHQKRFMLLDKEESAIWPIPLHYIKKEESKENGGFLMFDKKDMELKARNLEYIKLNYGQKGFYRVTYPAQILNRLGELLKNKKLSPLDGWGIENDLYAVARSSSIKIDVYLDFVGKYCFGSGFPLNSSVSNHLNALSMLLRENKSTYPLIKRISMAYHNEILNRLGWLKKEGESNTTIMLRSSAIYNLGMLGDESVLSKSRELFDGYLKGKEIEPNIRTSVYKIEAKYGGRKRFEKLIELYGKTEIPEEKIRLLVAIGCVSEPELIDEALKFTLTKNVRRQYVDFIPSLVTYEDYGKKIIWPWVKANWQKFKSMYERGPGGLDGFVSILSVLDDEKTKGEIEIFFKDKRNYRDDIKRSIAKTLEFIEINMKFKEFNRQKG